MKVLMRALAASCEELRARTGNPPLVNVNLQGTYPGISVRSHQSFDTVERLLIRTPCKRSSLASAHHSWVPGKDLL